jgi:hypothetical protein
MNGLMVLKCREKKGMEWEKVYVSVRVVES